MNAPTEASGEEPPPSEPSVVSAEAELAQSGGATAPLVPKAPPRFGRRKVIALAIVLLLVTLAATWGFAYWVANVKAVTWREILEGESWPVGPREFEDVITNVTDINTTYGRAVALDFAPPLATSPFGMALIASPAGTYRIGDRYHTTLHFQPVIYNGAPGVWAPELLTPLPGLWLTMGFVFDAVSSVAGLGLHYRGTNASGWVRYEVLTPNGDRFPLAEVPLSLRKEPALAMDIEYPFHVGPIDSAADWIVLAGYEYVAATGGYRPDWEIDRMSSLSDGISANRTVRFSDTSADGMVGDGDELFVHLPPIEGDGDYQTYMLGLGGGMSLNQGPAAGVKLILNGFPGPYEIFAGDQAGGSYQLTHGGEVVGPNITSTIRVGLLLAGSPTSYAEYRFNVTGEERRGLVDGAVQTEPITQGNVTVSFEDTNLNALLDTGDRFVISGLENRSHVQMWTEYRGSQGTRIAWIAGYGHIAGRLPFVSLQTVAQPPYSVTADVPFRHPELAFGKTLAVSLLENSTRVLDTVPLSDGMVASWPNGSLTFLDADGDGFLSTTDRFTIQGAPAARYRLEVSALFGEHRWYVEFGG